MTVNLLRLRRVEQQLKRIADALETIVKRQYGADSKAPEPEYEIEYVDQEGEWIREQILKAKAPAHINNDTEQAPLEPEEVDEDWIKDQIAKIKQEIGD
jgi:hypothetical protein